MRFSENQLTLSFWIYFAILVLWSLILFATNQKTTELNYLFNLAYALLYLSGGAVAFRWAKKLSLHNAVGRELFWIGAAITFFGAGLLVWSYYNLVLRIDTPFPSMADAFFVLYTPFLSYSVINLLHVFGVKTSKKLYFEGLLVFALAAYFVFSIGNPPDLSEKLPLLTKGLNIYYLLSDSLLITLSLILIRFTKGRIHKSFFYFLVAMTAMALGDFIFSYRTANGTYWNGDISDLIYAFSGLMFTLGIIKIVATQAIIYKYSKTTPPKQEN